MASTPTTVTPPSTPIMRASFLSEIINDSWCELQFKSGCSSANSLNHLNQSVNPEILEKLLHEAQKETTYPSTSISVQSSPKSPQTPITNISYHNDYDVQTSFNRIDPAITDDIQCLSLNSALINSKNNININDIFNDDNNIPKSAFNIGKKNLGLSLVQENENVCLKKDTDWIWYWSSRPQMHPPKEWNFVHPTNSTSRFSIRKHELMDNKLLSRETINKLIFTHLASFILGATLMYVYLKKHFKIQLFSFEKQ